MNTEKGKITVTSKYLFRKTQSTANIVYSIFPSGQIAVNVAFDIPQSNPNIPRIGLQTEIAASLKNIEWFGRGPHENYVDRKTSAAVGIYKTVLEDWITPYVMPQENGNRCDIRWINFSEKGETVLKIISNPQHLISVNIWPYTQEMLERSTHDFELKNHKNIVVNIDYLQMGVGGDNSWGLPVMEKYQIKPGKYEYQFYIESSKE